MSDIQIRSTSQSMIPTTHQKGKDEAWGSLSHSSREHWEPDGRNVEKQGGPWVRAEAWAGVPASGQPCPHSSALLWRAPLGMLVTALWGQKWQHQELPLSERLLCARHGAKHSVYFLVYMARSFPFGVYKGLLQYIILTLTVSEIINVLIFNV